MISAIQAILNFRCPSSTETPERPPEIHFWVDAVDVMADKKLQIQMIRTQFIIHINHIVIGEAS
jgi:hypothetical protein